MFLIFSLDVKEDPSLGRLEAWDDNRTSLSRFLLVRKDEPEMNEPNQKAISMRYNELAGKKHKGSSMICHWCLDVGRLRGAHG